MKFHRTLEKGQTNEWKTMYIDYVELKRLIRGDKKRFINEIYRNASKIDDFYFVKQNEMLNIKESIFKYSKGEKIRKLDHKDDLGVSFDNKSVSSLTIDESLEIKSLEIDFETSKNSLEDQNEQVVEKPNKNKKTSSIKRTLSLEEKDIDKNYVREDVVKKIKNANNSSSKMQTFMRYVKDIKNRHFDVWANTFKIGPFNRITVRDRRKALQKFMVDCNRIKKFADLNFLGFKKILKKYDKNHKENLTKILLPEISKKYFVTSKKMDKAIIESKELYQKTFTNNNKKKAKKVFRQILSPEKPNQRASFFGGAFFAISIFIIHLLDFEKDKNSYNVFLAFNLFFYGAFLFGICMIIFRRHFINYEFIFEFDVASDGTIYSYIFLVSVFALVHNLFFYIKLHKELYNVEALIPAVANLLLLLMPINLLCYSSRYFFVGALIKIFFPFFKIEFRHFYITDCLLSFAFCYKLILNHINIKENIIWYLCISLIFPVYRTIQSLRRQFDTKKGISHFLNAGKYLTSIIFIFTCFYHNNYGNKYTIYIKIIIGIISTFYSLYWDIGIDWGLPRRKRIYRSELYSFIIIFNVFLRTAWVFDKQIEKYSIQLCIAEITRRFLWTLLRVEFEHLNNCNRLKALSSMKLSDLFYKKDDSYSDDGDSINTACEDTIIDFEPQIAS